MSSRRVRVVVLCEDLAQYWFAYRCLVDCGWQARQIAPKVAPSGRGSAFTYVLDHYPDEVRANRKGRGDRNLLVLIDADTQPEGEREAQLAQRLRGQGQKPRHTSERIAHWVPRRQIETWIYFLTHDRADEETDYKRKHSVKESEHIPAARRFARTLGRPRALPAAAVPSMKKALAEFARLRGAPRRVSRRSPRKR